MKKFTALILALTLLTACLIPGAPAEVVSSYKSELIDNLDINLYDDALYLAEETADENEGFPIRLTFGLKGREKEVQIVAYFVLNEDLVDYVTVDLPESLLAQWDQYYAAQYADSAVGLLTDDEKPISVDEFENTEDETDLYALLYTPYMASGTANGSSVVNLFGVLYGIQIQVTGKAQDFDDDSLSAVFSAYCTAMDYALGLLDWLAQED